ncbi:hypothetical protein [Nocardia acidivorans]|uniref:hypothetical protein n=1 Tax=Nocardia acidivorans TaxID=404580 RepID=UPI00082CDA42|nr:hypothetical protein [Nocardia acidivorans]
MSSPHLPPEIMALLRTPAAEPTAETQPGADASETEATDDPPDSDDSDIDAAAGFTDAVTYEHWHREQSWSIREPPWS